MLVQGCAGGLPSSDCFFFCHVLVYKNSISVMSQVSAPLNLWFSAGSLGVEVSVLVTVLCFDLGGLTYTHGSRPLDKKCMLCLPALLACADDDITRRHRNTYC